MMFSGADRFDLKKLAITLFLISIALLVGCSGPGEQDKLLVVSGRTMGTGYTVKIVNNRDGTEEQIRKDIEDILMKINRQMSTYLSDSEISRFNRNRGTDWFSISPNTAEVIQQSLLVSNISNGAFDITVGPLVNLWGFGPESGDFGVPDRKAIDKAMLLTGYRKISVRLSPASVKKEIPEMYCDLSAIAKGYGVDKIAEYLDSTGRSDYLIEIGGEIRAKGENQHGRKWQVGIAIPDRESGVQRVVSLNNTSTATSGDYQNYFEIDGIRYSHIIDPRSGEPLRHKLASVTLIHDDCSFADAMATALYVLGPDDGYRLALENNLAVFLIIRENGGFVEKMTPEFKKQLSMSR